MADDRAEERPAEKDEKASVAVGVPAAVCREREVDEKVERRTWDGRNGRHRAEEEEEEEEAVILAERRPALAAARRLWRC